MSYDELEQNREHSEVETCNKYWLLAHSNLHHWQTKCKLLRPCYAPLQVGHMCTGASQFPLCDKIQRDFHK